MAESIFDLEEYKPYQSRWNTRIVELSRRKSYYDGSVYRKAENWYGFFGPRIYKGIKALYLPLSRAVDVDAGIIPGGWKLDEDMPEEIETARDTVFDWSSWSTDGVLYVHYGAQYGVSGLKISDLREVGQVIIKPLDPCCFMLVSSKQYTSTPDLAFEIEIRENAQGRFEYAEIITPEEIRTYRNGEPFGFDGREPSYPNELGFIPLVEIRHIETGEMLGECTYQKAIPLLDECNTLASYLADIIKKHAEPQWTIIGAEAGDLVKSGDNVWFIPVGGDAKPLVAPIDIAGTLAFIQEIRSQVFGSLPELAFDELKSKTQIATATLELQLMELVLKIKRCRPNYDAGLVAALRMAGKAGTSMGVSEISILDNEELALDDNRPVLPVDRLTEIQIELQELALEREQNLGIDEGETTLEKNISTPDSNLLENVNED